ncbi:hypothetical protein Z043_110580, partial [Scleropages formosus]
EQSRPECDEQLGANADSGSTEDGCVPLSGSTCTRQVLLGGLRPSTDSHRRLTAPPLPVRPSPALLGRAHLRLELHELLGHLIVGTLGEDAQHRLARVVHVQSPAQGTPAGTAPPLSHIAQLHDGDAHDAVCPAKAVVLHAHLQLVALWPILVAQNAEREMGKRKDLSNFDKGQIVMARQLRQSISKMAGLAEMYCRSRVPNMQWLGPTKSGPRKDN